MGVGRLSNFEREYESVFYIPERDEEETNKYFYGKEETTYEDQLDEWGDLEHTGYPVKGNDSDLTISDTQRNHFDLSTAIIEKITGCHLTIGGEIVEISLSSVEAEHVEPTEECENNKQQYDTMTAEDFDFLYGGE